MEAALAGGDRVSDRPRVDVRAAVVVRAAAVRAAAEVVDRWAEATWVDPADDVTP